MMRVANLARRAVRLGVVLAAVWMLAHPAAGQTPGGSPRGEPQAGKGVAPASRPWFDPAIPANLGEPLVEEPGGLQRLDPLSPVWIDKKHKQIILIGSVCRADYPLEFFATYPDRGYESVVVVYTRPSVVHAGLLALGAKPGSGARYKPKFAPASGTAVEIDVCWKDRDGKRHKARAQDWVRDIKTRKPLEVTWVFAGSVFWADKSSGAKSYLADRGDFISVASLPTAMLDLPVESDTALESRSFEGFVERLPPPGTPVTLVLRPQLAATRH